MTFSRNKYKKFVFLLSAAVLFSFSLNIFLVPSKVIAGGFSGLATVINVISDIPVGITILFLNIPFLIMNAYVFGIGYIKKALFGVFLTSALTELCFPMVPLFENRLINATIGGMLMGVSLGMIFSSGYTSGGSDLVAALIHNRHRAFKLSTALFLCDAVIVTLGFVLTFDVYGVLLAFVSIAVQARLIDITMAKIEEHVFC